MKPQKHCSRFHPPGDMVELTITCEGRGMWLRGGGAFDSPHVGCSDPGDAPAGSGNRRHHHLHETDLHTYETEAPPPKSSTVGVVGSFPGSRRVPRSHCSDRRGTPGCEEGATQEPSENGPYASASHHTCTDCTDPGPVSLELDCRTP